MKLKVKRVNWLLIFSIILLHFMIVRPAGFPLTFAPFAILIFLFTQVKFVVKSKNAYLGVVFFIIWPLFVYGIYEISGGKADVDEFLKTYLLWVFAIFALTLASSARLKSIRDYSLEFTVALGVISVFSFAQILVIKLFDSDALYNPFGEYTYMGEYKVGNMVGYNSARAPGFYLEPSFCAFIIFFLISVILIKRENLESSKRLQAFSLLSVAITGSATGLLAIITLIGLRVVSTTVKHNPFKIVAILVVPFLIGIFSEYFISNRIAEVNAEGTSGYWRLVAPLVILSKVLIEHPLGVPFGQMEEFVLSLRLQHGAGIGKSIDNGVYYLFFCFGWLVVPFIIGIIAKLFNALFKGEQNGLTYWWYVIGSLQFSGGIFLPEYVYPLLLISIQYRKSILFENRAKHIMSIPMVARI